MRQKIAKIISVLGHPLLTIPVYTIIITFSVYDYSKAFFVSFIIVGCIFLPITFWNYFQTKRGRYTNFDVSVQKDRDSMYLFAIPVLTLALIIFYFTHQSNALILNILFALILLVASYLVNFFIKCSGHVSLTIFLSFMLMPVNFVASIFILFCSILIGWSRVVLKRHTIKEAIIGMFLGLIVGISMLYFLNFFRT